jgi:hypothetical protein
MSRQVDWQSRMRAEGRCINCGKPKRRDILRCDVCADKVMNKARKMAGNPKRVFACRHCKGTDHTKPRCPMLVRP